ncbi:MAG: hypothetical protein IH885_10055 [Myxococcales bacterium]|nr:hypothetical protein [Myxococcales bacterium]
MKASEKPDHQEEARRRRRRKRKPKLTADQLDAREAQYKELEDPMIVHLTAVEAKRAGLAPPEWVVREWTKWSGKLVKAVRRARRTLTAEEIGRAFELLEAGAGRGSPLSRGRTYARDATLMGLVDGIARERGISLYKAIEEIAGEWRYEHAALQSRYYRHRAKTKE